MLAQRLIHWVGIAIVLIGCGIALWMRQNRRESWLGMGRVFDEL